MPPTQATTQLLKLNSSPFHAGEQAVQSRLGVRDSIEPWARQVVRPCLPEEHRQFFSRLPFVVAAARDHEGRPWASLLTGQTGFIDSPDPEHLRLATQTLPGDALSGALTPGSTLGLLGIELETQRRNRVNGTLSEGHSDSLEFEVSQSFGNCPQYITQRAWRHVDVNQAEGSASQHQHLTEQMKQSIRGADTMFIASGYDGDQADDPTHGMDASHRGGAPGFVKIAGNTQLVFPDYSGNRHFNTIGNLVMDNRVGLLFVDFERGGVLQISGTATIEWDGPELTEHPGAQRLVRVEITHIVLLERALPLRWDAPQVQLEALRLVKKVTESSDVMSFTFAAADGNPLPSFRAGQYLPISVAMDAHGETVTRTYSLSNGPGDGLYRISVKRQPKGVVSRYLHDVLQPGDSIVAARPTGDFTIQNPQRPIALLSAGIGVTPLLSMLTELAQRSGAAPVYFVHGARNSTTHALADEVHKIAAGTDSVHRKVVYSQPLEGDIAGRHYDQKGRITTTLLAQMIPRLDADFYLCGPPAFVADLSAALDQQGIPAARISAETF